MTYPLRDGAKGGSVLNGHQAHHHGTSDTPQSYGTEYGVDTQQMQNDFMRHFGCWPFMRVWHAKASQGQCDVWRLVTPDTFAKL